MRIGILSDTHDHADMMEKGVEALRARDADYYIHCGDVGGQRVLDCLAGLPSAFVWGNNDWDRPALQRYATKLGITCYGAGADIRLGEKRLAIIHGDDLVAFRRIVDGQQFDYLLYGHTHVKAIERKGKTLLINPGALYRAREKTVALLETTTDEVEFLTVAPVTP